MTSAPDNIDPRIWTLTNAVCQGTISKEEAQELESLLTADPRALEFYVDFLKINVEILWLLSIKPHSTMDSSPQAPPAPLTDAPERSPTLSFFGDWANFFHHHSSLSFMLLFVIFGMAVLATTYWLSPSHSNKVSAESDFVAQITATKGCQWSKAITPPTEWMQLQASQQLQLEKGMVQITYASGAVVLLEGPVSFTVGSPNSGFLSQGKLTARADSENSRQFTITTLNSRFVDLGTEFGVMIDDKGRAAVAVFAGKVHAEAKLADGRWDTPVALSAGEAVVCVERKFTSYIAQRSNFPTLHALPPPPPATPYQRWMDASGDLQKHKDLVAYYDFQPDPNNQNMLVNRASSGAIFNGEIQNATWTQGRFAEKGALEFMAADAGVRVNLPGEYRQMTVIAWVSNKLLTNHFNGVLMSDNFTQSGQLHLQIMDSRQINMNIHGQLSKIANGQEVQSSTKTIPADSLNNWCMIAGVVDTPDQCALYLNGEYFENLELKQIPPVRIGQAMIGGWIRGNSPDKDYIRNFTGRIDELMIFQKALPAEEIKQIYETGKP
jgi:hypothetical protein